MKLSQFNHGYLGITLITTFRTLVFTPLLSGKVIRVTLLLWKCLGGYFLHAGYYSLPYSALPLRHVNAIVPSSCRLSGSLVTSQLLSPPDVRHQGGSGVFTSPWMRLHLIRYPSMSPRFLLTLSENHLLDPLRRAIQIDRTSGRRSIVRHLRYLDIPERKRSHPRLPTFPSLIATRGKVISERNAHLHILAP